MKIFQTLFITAIFLFSSAVFAGKVNINNATAEQISTTMTGIGKSKAKAIVEYRSSHGKFKSVQDLENVDGIGSKTVEKNKSNITL